MSVRRVGGHGPGVCPDAASKRSARIRRGCPPPLAGAQRNSHGVGSPRRRGGEDGRRCRRETVHRRCASLRCRLFPREQLAVRILPPGLEKKITILERKGARIQAASRSAEKLAAERGSSRYIIPPPLVLPYSLARFDAAPFFLSLCHPLSLSLSSWRARSTSPAANLPVLLSPPQALSV